MASEGLGGRVYRGEDGEDDEGVAGVGDEGRFVELSRQRRSGLLQRMMYGYRWLVYGFIEESTRPWSAV